MRSFARAIIFTLAALAICGIAQAGKVTVEWTNPTTNTNGAPITDLASVTVQWGSCAGTSFGTLQSSLTTTTTVPGAQVSAVITPMGLSPVCLRCYATNAEGASSAMSSTVVWTPPPQPGKPVTLGQPIPLP